MAAATSALPTGPVPPQVGMWFKRMPTAVEKDNYEEEEEQTAQDVDDGQDGRDGSTDGSPEVANDLGDPADLAEDQKRSSELIARLEAAGASERRVLIDWLIAGGHTLALSQHGCRVVQKALEVAGGSGRDRLAAELESHAAELYQSLHGNYVLTKMVEVMPPATLGGMINMLEEQGPSAVARHRFGCRVLERLVQHCSEKEIGGLMDKLIADCGALCRHPFGNFVVQVLLEHGSPIRRACILQQLLEVVPNLAMHRTASHVVEKALYYSDEQGQSAIVSSLLQAPSPNSLLDVAGNRYGSFVAEKVVSLQVWGVDEVHRRMAEGLPELAKSHFGRRVAEACGLPLPVNSGTSLLLAAAVAAY